jgi:hypothetical protein
VAQACSGRRAAARLETSALRRREERLVTGD